MKIGRLILKARLACSLPALNREELAASVEAWAEVLNEEIPEHRLDDCYLSAMKNKLSTFALGAPDLVVAWKSIRSAEMYKSPAMRQLRGDVCGQCNGTGYKQVEVNGYKVSRACDCEPEGE